MPISFPICDLARNGVTEDSKAMQVASHETRSCRRAGAAASFAVYMRGPGPMSVKTGRLDNAPPHPQVDEADRPDLSRGSAGVVHKPIFGRCDADFRAAIDVRGRVSRTRY